MRINNKHNYLRLKNNLPIIHIKNNTAPIKSDGKAVDNDKIVIDSLFGGSKEVEKSITPLYLSMKSGCSSIMISPKTIAIMPT